MPKAMMCIHGITPKRNCEICKKNYQKEFNKNYTKSGKSKEWQRVDREYNREKYNINSLNRGRKKCDEVISILGNSCCVCGVTPTKRRVSFHEIHGNSHKENPYYILKHIEDFVPMCHQCHKTLHGFFNNKEKLSKLLELLKS